MKKIILYALISIFSVSCISYYPGSKAQFVSGEKKYKLTISAKKEHGYSNKYLTFLNFSFGNDSDEWARIKSITLDFNNPDINKKCVVIAGEDLKTWITAVQYKMRVDAYNASMFLGALAFAGVVAGVTSSDTGIQTAGFSTALAASTIDTANHIYRKKSDMERASLFPENHLYREFSIPSGYVVKKFIVLDINKEDFPENIFLTIKLKNKKTSRYKIPIKTRYNNQSNI